MTTETHTTISLAPPPPGEAGRPTPGPAPTLPPHPLPGGTQAVVGAPPDIPAPNPPPPPPRPKGSGMWQKLAAEEKRLASQLETMAAETHDAAVRSCMAAEATAADSARTVILLETLVELMTSMTEGNHKQTEAFLDVAALVEEQAQRVERSRRARQRLDGLPDPEVLDAPAAPASTTTWKRPKKPKKAEPKKATEPKAEPKKAAGKPLPPLKEGDADPLWPPSDPRRPADDPVRLTWEKDLAKKAKD